MNLKEALKGKISDEELALVRRSFDVVGDIAIIEVPKEIAHRENLIGNTLLSLLKNVKTVLVKEGGHSGKYRRQKMRCIAGEDKRVTSHKESGVRIMVDVERCYYSPRLANDRLSIARKVRSGERVLVVGSGVGPYPLVIAKNADPKEVVGIEINPVAHKFALENARLNKLEGKVRFVKCDVRDFGRSLFDRVIVAMPHEGVDAARFVFKNVRSGGFLHVMAFTPEGDLKGPARALKELAKKCTKRPLRILRTVLAGQHAVRSYRVRIDAKLG
ncbi:methyltransferase domain-containing protein [Candidatus Woesearchaeota archaeon]|nr:MAG: methyltransferase domain-containing protein [Candidatus Woesearchaeota archaeon]